MSADDQQRAVPDEGAASPRPLVGSHISEVVEKARKAGGWEIDTSSEKWVDFFSETAYPFRLDVGIDGIVSATSRPPELMKRYDDLIEAKYPSMRWDDEAGDWVVIP